MPMELDQRRQASSLVRRCPSMMACRWASVPGPCVRPVASSSWEKSKLGSSRTSRRNSLFSGFVDTAGAVFLKQFSDLRLLEFFHGEGGGVEFEFHLAQQLGQGIAHLGE